MVYESPLCLDGMKARADSGGMRERNILVRSFLKSVLPKTAIHSQCSLALEATGNHKKVGRILIWFSRWRIKTDRRRFMVIWLTQVIGSVRLKVSIFKVFSMSSSLLSIHRQSRKHEHDKNFRTACTSNSKNGNWTLQYFQSHCI